jgi:hypothetical protein
MAVSPITAYKKKLLNRMNGTASVVKLGNLLANNVIYAALTTTVGGDANEVYTISGLAVGDIPIVTVNTAGGTPRTVTTAKVTATDQLTVVMSGDPSTDHVLNIIVLRAV